MPRQGREFADLSISAVLYRSSVEYVKPPEDSVSEAICIRRDFACGVKVHKVRKSICVGATRADSSDEVANKTAWQYIKFLTGVHLTQIVLMELLVITLAHCTIGEAVVMSGKNRNGVVSLYHCNAVGFPLQDFRAIV